MPMDSTDDIMTTNMLTRRHRRASCTPSKVRCDEGSSGELTATVTRAAVGIILHRTCVSVACILSKNACLWK
jgi:hypothetical protein